MVAYVSVSPPKRSLGKGMRQLLLLHGFTGAPSSWRAVESELPHDVRVLAPLLTGHGRPPTAPEIGGFDEEVDRLVGMLGAGDWEVAGYSLGARLALGLLVRPPRRFIRAVLISGRPGLQASHERDARIAADEALALALERDGLESFVDSWEKLPLFASQSTLSDELRRSERARRESHEASGLAHSLRVTGLGRMPSYWNDLERIGVPVEVVVGELDRTFCAIGDAVVGKLPKARLSCVTDAGHNLLLERPAAVARAIAGGTST